MYASDVAPHVVDFWYHTVATTISDKSCCNCDSFKGVHAEVQRCFLWWFIEQTTEITKLHNVITLCDYMIAITVDRKYQSTLTRHTIEWTGKIMWNNTQACANYHRKWKWPKDRVQPKQITNNKV